MRTRACVIALLLCLCSAVAHSPPAAAQEKDAVTETARRRFQEGVRFFDRGRYEDARAAFLQAYALRRHPAVLLNLAQSELRSQHYVDAARHFSAFLREATTATAAERADAEKGLAQARMKLGRVQITVSSAGATVSVDGEPVGDSPLPEAVDVGPGTHKIEARQGAKSATATVTITAGKVSTASLTLGEASAATATAVPVEPRAAPGEAPAAKAAPGEPAEAGTAPRPAPTNTEYSTVSTTSTGFFGWFKSSPFAWFGLGATAIGLGTAGVAWVASRNADSNAQSVADQIKSNAAHSPNPVLRTPNPCGGQNPEVVAYYGKACGVLQDNIDKRDTDTTIAIIGGVVAGVGVAAIVTGYLFRSKKGERAALSAPVVAPVIGPGTGGLTVVGSF